MLNPMDLTGRRVMVTGASSGIGRATAIYLSKLGAHLVLVARRREKLEETLALLQGEGHHVAECDLQELSTIPQWMKSLAADTGPLSGVVHCAGIVSVVPLRMLTPSKIDDILHVNLNAALMLAKGFRQRGVVAEQGSLVFVSSVAGFVGQRGLASYCASKGALIATTRSLSLELVEDQIRVNTVAPGLVETDMIDRCKNEQPADNLGHIRASHPLGAGRPEDVAQAIAFLIADTSRWITGTTLVVDGGYLANGM